MSRCEDEQMWRWEGVKMSRCEDEQMWRWADVKMSRCEDEQMWRWAGVKMSRCEDEQMWRWADVKMSRCEDEQMWRWADVKMSRCEDEKVWRWADVKMSRCEDEQMWRWADVKMSRCEDEQMWRWAGVKMSRCEDEQMWRWADVKMSRWDTDPHYWKNPALRRSREKWMIWGYPYFRRPPYIFCEHLQKIIDPQLILNTPKWTGLHTPFLLWYTQHLGALFFAPNHPTYKVRPSSCKCVYKIINGVQKYKSAASDSSSEPRGGNGTAVAVSAHGSISATPVRADPEPQSWQPEAIEHFSAVNAARAWAESCHFLRHFLRWSFRFKLWRFTNPGTRPHAQLPMPWG